MAFSVVTSDDYDNGGTTWQNIALTEGSPAAGDLGVVIGGYFENGNSETWAAPSGYTAQGGSNVFSGSADAESRAEVFTKAYGSAAGVTAGRTNSMFAAVMYVVFRGTNALTYDAASIAYSAASGGDVTTIDAPSQSGTDGQGLICCYFISDPVTSVVDPSGMTRARAPLTNTLNVHMYYEDLTATEATGVRTLSWTTAEACIACSFLVDGVSDAAGGGSILPLLNAYHNG